MIDDYSYEELFADHYAANFIIVDKGATVTINAGIAPTVSGETFLITNEELQNETIKLSESLCSDNNLVFGKMEASKLTFTFKDKNTYPTDLTETEIDVYLYFNGDSSSLFKVGTYTIDADKYSADRYTRSITAYDQIYYLKDVDITSWYNDYFGDGQRHAIGFAIVSLFNWIKDENDDYPDSPKIDIDIESGYNLTNALFTIGKTIESDSISFEFFMQRVLEWNGAFGHINRNGNFEFKVMQWYDAEPVRTVTNDDRIPPTEFDIVSTWGIGGIDVYDADNIRKFSVRNTNKKKPSIYTIVDSFVVADRDAGDSDVDTALKKLHQVINHYNYKSCKATCTGDLCVEVGDRINVNFFAEETDPRDWFRSYVLERTFSGIQGMTDVYQSKGDKKQPVFTVTNDNWHNGSSSSGTSGAGTGGVSKVNSDLAESQYVEIVRNYGFRFLDEPEAVCEYDQENHTVKLKWEDPADLTDNKPIPCTWAKTYVVKREGERALNIYQGTVLVTSTTKNEYKESWFEDNTVEDDKKYYYSIMPCDTKDDIRWTCCFSVNTNKFVLAPTIEGITQNDNLVTVNYTIPSATYDYIKLVYKKDAIPTSKDDGTAIDILQSSTSQIVNDIADGGTYWFVIYTDKTSSEPKFIETNDTRVLLSNIQAEDQLKDSITRSSPSTIYGTMGTYNSGTNSYYFASECRMKYSGISYATSFWQNLSRLDIEYELEITNQSVGENTDSDVSLIDSSNNYVVINVKAANGSNDPTRQILELNNKSYQWNGDAPLDISTNQGAFHTVRYELSINNGTVNTCRVYLDEVLFAIKNDINVSLNISSTYYLALTAMDKSYIRNVRVKSIESQVISDGA